LSTTGPEQHHVSQAKMQHPLSLPDNEKNIKYDILPEGANLISSTALSEQLALLDNCQHLVLESGRTVIFLSCLMILESLHLYISTFDIR
jgi:hypothetical protein